MTESITIEVRIFATLRELLGVKKFSMTLIRGTTIRELLKKIENQFMNGRDFLKAVLHPDIPDQVRDYVKFVINGEIILPKKILDFTINTEGDVIAIFPPVGGG